MPITVLCPFYINHKYNQPYVLCEDYKLIANEQKDIQAYVRKYCAGDWKACSIAKEQWDKWE